MPGPHALELPPMPPQIAALQRDMRGYPLPAHVLRDGKKPVNLTKVCPMRYLFLAVWKRCTICGRRFAKDEDVWFPAEPSQVAVLLSGGVAIAGEGVSHKECLVWAAMACPYLAHPGSARKTTKYVFGEVQDAKGSPAPDYVLVGGRYAGLSPYSQSQLGLGAGVIGITERIDYHSGPELLPVLEELIASKMPPPSVPQDEVVLALFNDPSTARVASVFGRVLADVRAGRPAAEPAVLRSAVPKTPRNTRCPCGSGRKYKQCCLQKRPAH